jgi:hypothetical protein
MATQKGTHITDFDATPFDSVNSRLHGGVLKASVDTFELADTANGDIAHVFKIPVDAVLHSVKFASDDLGTAGTVDIGFYRKNDDGTYSAVDADALANNIDVNSAAVSLTEYRFSVKGIETANQAAYTLAGLSARPAYGDLYISLTTDTGTTAAGTVTMQIQYTE